MKRISSLLFGLLTCGFSFSQMVAPDWTLTDCASNNHNLYSILDSQEVVVMEFSMGCASCTQAAGHLMNLKDQYAISHPGKVNFFYMDYWGNDCSSASSTASSYDFDAIFANCEPQKNSYYPSIYPMPAIVIAAGNYHTVIYQSQTWLNADTATIKTAIDQFFVTVGLDENKNDDAKIFPNPVTDQLHVNLSEFPTGQLKINLYSIHGELIKLPTIPVVNNSFTIDVSGLPKGTYVLEMSPSWDVKIRKIFVKN